MKCGVFAPRPLCKSLDAPHWRQHTLQQRLATNQKGPEEKELHAQTDY